MQVLPGGLDLGSLPGPKRGVSPAIYIRDEIVPSPSGDYFALAYTIFEASMGNDVGRVLWGRVIDGHGEVLGNPGFAACCWSSPWASWVTDEAFTFKVQFHDGVRTHLPLVVVDVVHQRFAVVPGSNALSSRPSDVLSCPRRFERFTSAALLQAIAAA